MMNDKIALKLNELLLYCRNVMPSDADVKVCKDSLDMQTNNSNSIQKLTCLYFYKVLMELSGSFVCVYEKEEFFSSATLLRSFFEYYIELKWINKDFDNRFELRDKDATKQKSKMINSAKQSKSHSFDNFKEDPRTEESIKRNKEYLKDHNGVSIEEMCKDIGFSEFYTPYYRQLSEFAHVNLRRLSNNKFNGEDYYQIFDKYILMVVKAIKCSTSMLAKIWFNREILVIDSLISEIENLFENK
ncbi:MAG: hypothetical protein JEZ07_12675 [Phycisphaerae bacterium]|nr:hypothetical protein [Phycisphaerae bacterium]